MTFKWKTVRVFISSTFRDMHAERDYLVKYVFPDLREWCEKWKLHLVDIDLRWGVTQSEAETGKVLDVCLEQIDGSRPFFICMLGNRYGWVPKPKEVPKSTRETYDRLKDKEDFSVTHLEIHHAVLEPLKSLDVLEDAPHAFFYFRDEKSLPKPEEIEGWSNEARKEYRNTFFEPDPKNFTRLSKLKTAVNEHYEDMGKQKNNPKEAEERIYGYSPAFDPSLPNPEQDKLQGRLTPSSLKDFGDRIMVDLKKAFNQQFHDRIVFLSVKREIEALDPLEAELDYHESFVENRTRLFIGRDELLQKLRDYVESDSKNILAVYGQPGSGKSALLAKFYRNLTESNNINHGFSTEDHGNSSNQSPSSNFQSKMLVIPHFIGASPNSSALHNLLRRMCKELKARFEIKDEIPTDTNKLPQTFKDFLAKVKGKTIILIDGLNQLDKSGRALGLNWLPNDLPENVKIIASTLEGDTKEALKKKTDARLDVTPLTDDERIEIIQKMPSVFCKTLEDKHIEILLRKQETRNPLYLKVALEELRVFGSFEKLGEKVAEFPDNVIDLFVSVLERLENDHRENPGIVEKLFCLLECSRYGLTARELRELLADDKDNINQIILRQVRDYLLKRGELIDFFHQGLSKAIQKKYFSKDEAIAWHRELAEYFKDKQLWIKEREPNRRKLEEQPYQQTKGERWEDLEETLCDLKFVEAKCVTAEMVVDLIIDYNLALDTFPEAQEERRKERKHEKRVKKYTENLIAHAKGKIDRLEIIPSVEPWSEEKIKAETERIKNNPTRLDSIRSFSQFVNSESHVLIKFGDRPSFCLQHAYNYANSSPVASQAEYLIKDVKDVLLLRSPSQRPDYNPHPALLKTLEGHALQVTSVSVTPDGKRAVSGSNDETLRVWDLGKEVCLKTLEGHTGGVESVSITPDGKRAVSGSSDHTLHVWDLEKGVCLKTLKGHTKGVSSVSVTPDGKKAVSGGETLRVWDLEKGTCLKTLEGHTLEGHIGGVLSVSVTPDGKKAVSGSPDHTLRVWDLEKGVCLKTLKDHTGLVYSVSVTPDGKRAVSGSSDHTLRVWDIEKGVCIAVCQAASNISSLSRPGADGRFACGTSMGEVICFSPHNLVINHPIVTAVRLRLSGDDDVDSRWDDRLTTLCEWCGKRIIPSASVLDTIFGITRNANLSPDQSPCLELPSETWDEPHLLSECPLCRKPLKFNPFIVDNRDRY